MLDKLNSINNKLQELLKEKADLGLSVIEEQKPRSIENRKYQSSVVDESRIVGRQAEKEALVQQLLQADGPSHQNFSIVPIFGMGGVGKTTLARLLYDDQQVKDHFELKGWVCISDDFDILGRTKDIFKSLGGELKELQDFNKLHEALRDYVRGKRFLLVIDDLWCESYTDWQTLIGPLCTCAPKSKIIITTRKDQLLRKLGCDPLNKQLESLPHDDALSLFALHALGVQNFDSHVSLKPHATHVAGEYFVRLDIEAKKDTREEMLEKYHHMSFVREEYATYKKFEAFKRAKSLRTFLATSAGVLDMWQNFYLSNKIVADLVSELPLLRVLSLSNFKISEVPESIGTLRHLRYLNLSQTEITYLPENVSNLYNLETLILVGCERLSKLPNNFLKLKNLRHLDIRKTWCLDQMPLGIGELKSLQTLSTIIIGGESGFEITKLKDLENLCGKVSIVGLDKVQNATDARVANFPQKRLSKLEVLWSDEWGDSRNEMLEKDVLDELKPHNDKLIKLKIRSYGGLEFPKWVGDPLFVHLKHVSLSGCKRCASLPPLAQLESLKELFIEDLDGVKAVGMELLGKCRAFPLLEILSFKRMHGWEKWSTNNGEDVFPCLKQLVIEDCPNLVQVTLEVLPPSLKSLNLDNCDCGVLRRLIEVASSVTKLRISSISGLNDVMWRGVTHHLEAVVELSIQRCNEIRYLWESEAAASKALANLRDLKVDQCNNLVSLGEREYDEDSNLHISSIRRLEVSSCQNMECCSCPDSIVDLRILLCSSITSISLQTRGGGHQQLKSLYIQDCNKLLEKEWGGQNNKTRSSMPMLLENVEIDDWPNLKSVINLNCLVHLTRLVIINCEGMESLPDNELPNLASLKHLVIKYCPRMDGRFPRGLWPPNLQSLQIGRLKKPISEWGSQNFPTSLVDLVLEDGSAEDGVSSSSQFSNILPDSLTHLELWGFEKLESFSIGLQHLQHLSFCRCTNLHKLSHPQRLTSLQHLFFYKCPNVKDLPEKLLPKLLSLRIFGNCPNLEERCSKGGSYWSLISHIPCIDILPGFSLPLLYDFELNN
ncbi:hypothetical protein E3N88_08048 [Mikania micrantha]|uniref:Uncharacterized protein n=1 Tax=Mikania micrantha TaxID=192012 RepID=A0A5N6PH83_9ASTR|nr:hypothetical protein E3N88_08048 [Mikania micrantha]